MRVRAWHMYHDGYARAFFIPRTNRERLTLLIRGWFPHSIGGWWQKPNNKQRFADRNMIPGSP